MNVVERLRQLSREHFATSARDLRRIALGYGVDHSVKDAQEALKGNVATQVLAPKARFTLVDSVGKKITVVTDIAERLGLKNVDVKNARAETMNHEHDFVTGRAVADLRTFVHNTRQLLCKGAKHSLPNGILYWQGGDPAVEAELSFLNPVFSFELRPLLWNDEKFEGKRIVLYRSQDLLRCKKPDLPGMTQ